MRDLKAYLSATPVLSILRFGALSGLLIEISRFPRMRWHSPPPLHYNY